MITYLPQIWEFLLSIFSAVVSLYTQNPVLSAIFALLLLDRIFGIFDLIRKG